ncbi:MAG: preprotein translocase subunit SecA [Desulfovibrionaceae bacterium]|nr:preprotein translocase subunit SecA [Desulfovibrionaceae bacterium]
MFSFLIKKIFGSANDRYLKTLRPLVQKTNALEPQIKAMTDEDFPVRIAALKEEVAGGRTLDELMPEVFALVREASVRTLNMRHFDVQLIGGAVLHAGKIAEMKTGEGKTLVATLAVVLNALAGRGVHVVTVNDYLARRDAAWMGAIYNFLGLSVGVIVHGLSDAERKAAYAADITYGTNNEFGFDYLRDNMKFYKDQLCQRDHYFAIVDEVDSILIDEARTPLIISGAGQESTSLYARIDTVVPGLKRDDHFSIDEKNRSLTLTEDGVTLAEQLLNIENLYDPQNIALQHHLLQALRAHHLFKRDVDYIVHEGQVVIVDEFTGRPMPGRRFSDGLHQALEAKEGVKIEQENHTLASITFQNYFRMYDKLAGMTGTADTEAVEFKQIYNLDVVSIPTHMPMIRKDYPDYIFHSAKEKFEAIANEIKALHEKGQPVLVGTISIENSELISNMLKKMGIPHNVLNAKQHEQEAAIVAEAGKRGKVTIATNMAGRGTDIKLDEETLALGGLHILGTERHGSRRIDNQLRGRSGRQGDPGSSRFFLSLEDDLLRLFGSERFKGLLSKLGMGDGQPIEDRMVSSAIERAQKRVEAYNFEIRKTLLDYDNVMNQQREVIYSLRREAMLDDPAELLDEFREDMLDAFFDQIPSGQKLDEETRNALMAELEQNINLSRFWPHEKGLPSRDDVEAGLNQVFEELKTAAGPAYLDVLRYFILEELDRCWKEHLIDMDHLRDGIGLRGYGQRDPKQEYKREGFEMFRDMLDRIKANTFKVLTRLRLRRVEEQPEAEMQKPDDAPAASSAAPAPAPSAAASAPASEQDQASRLGFKHTAQPASMSYSGPGENNRPRRPQTIKKEVRVGRNDPCPCGSGKKFKKCCGA